MELDLEAHRPVLLGHCYRMLGSAMDADDAVQETLIRAWRAQERFDGRSSLLTWLYRIATNVCLDALNGRSRRASPIEDGPLCTPADNMPTRPRSHWLEPIATARVLPPGASPDEQLAIRQSVRLAFVAALQHLPPKQRAVLLLVEVLGFSAAEAAESLEISVPAANSALQRARTALAARHSSTPTALTPAQCDLLERYVEAFHRYDVDALAALLREDATLSMPPYAFWLQGPVPIAAWLRGRGAGCRASRLLPVDACGVPAFAQYRPAAGEGYRAWAIVALELDSDRIASWISFLDVETLFPHFGLPLDLPK